MVFVNRKHKIEKEVSESISETNNSNENQEIKPPVHTESQIRNFREQAIQVLNILESQGIDIYDPSRRPDMYIKKRMGQLNDTKIKRITEIVSKQEEPKKEIISNSLIEAMMKSKNQN